MSDKSKELSCMYFVSGATSFLLTEYQYLAVFMGGFSIIIFLFLASVENFTQASIFNGAFSTIAFILGALTSTVSGYLGMKIATCWYI